MLSGFLPDDYFVSHDSHGIFYQNAFSPGELSVNKSHEIPDVR